MATLNRPATFFSTFFAAACIVHVAGAACLDENSIKSGVAFTRADGSAGVARTNGSVIEIDYSARARGDRTNIRYTRLGIYEDHWFWGPTESSNGGIFKESISYHRTRKEPPPTPESTWSTTLRTEVYTYWLGADINDEPEQLRTRVRYNFLASQEVELSGCAYTAIPVSLRGSDTKLIRRWLFFPDLGFGLETRMTDAETGKDIVLGLTTMKAAP